MVLLGVESWIWYSAVAIVAGSRYVSRRLTFGTFRKFQADDYLMVFALCTYTTLIVSINFVFRTSSNLLPPGFDVHSLSHHDVHEREFGSKLILVVEQCQCATIWAAKGCLIILYLRLTQVRKTGIAIKVLAGYVATNFVVMEILYFAVWCRPFNQYWAVPTNSTQCSAATNHLITNAVFNLSSDCIMLALGLPMFLRMNLPWQRKIPLIFIFSLGIFVILAAILNKVYSFSEPFGSKWTYWYVRESSTALLVANLPFVWTFWRRITRYGTAKGMSRVSKSFIEKSVPRNDSDAQESKAHETKFRESKQIQPGVTAEDWLSGDLSKDLEMGENTDHADFAQAKDRAVSFAEMLGQDCNPAANTHKEPTIYTHPQLFYSRRHTAPQGMEAAVLSDKGIMEAVRRSSSVDGPYREVSDTSGGESSLNTNRSPGSFV